MSKQLVSPVNAMPLSIVRRLAHAALLMAIVTPARKNEFSGEARVPWDSINEVRAALEAGNYDWRDGCKRYREALAANRAAGDVERQRKADDWKRENPGQVSESERKRLGIGDAS